MLKRYQNNVGKCIDGALYIHRKYAENLYIDVATLIRGWNGNIPPDFNIIKLSLSTADITLLNSPDFDTAPEPSILEYWHYSSSSDQWKYHRYAEDDNAPVYHHKWLFVMDDYSGFDVEESKRRSEWIESLPIKHLSIGYQRQWKEILEKFGSSEN
jgi:hypothetical protein